MQLHEIFSVAMPWEQQNLVEIDEKYPQNFHNIREKLLTGCYDSVVIIFFYSKFLNQKGNIFLLH